MCTDMLANVYMLIKKLGYARHGFLLFDLNIEQNYFLPKQSLKPLNHLTCYSMINVL